MNLKTHKKGLVALALVFFMIVPMLSAINFVHATNPAAGAFSVVQQGTGGTTNVNSVTVPASPNPIGSYVYFDIYVSGASNVWGWTIPTVSWNPAVLQLVGVTEGPWLKNNVPGGDGTDFVGNSGSLWNNHLGDIGGGLSEAITADDQAATSAGVVTTLKFEVSGYGTSPVTIAGGSLTDSSEDAAAQNYNAATSMTSATVTVIAPPLSISLYQSGSTTLSGTTISSTTNPIGDTFKVDAYIQGDVATMDLWGWSLGVSWDPSIVEMTKITEGSFLNQSSTTYFAAGDIDNVAGKIQGGVEDAYTSYVSTIAPAGVLMTMTFQVVGYGSCNIQLSQGTPTLY